MWGWSWACVAHWSEDLSCQISGLGCFVPLSVFLKGLSLVGNVSLGNLCRKSLRNLWRNLSKAWSPYDFKVIRQSFMTWSFSNSEFFEVFLWLPFLKASHFIEVAQVCFEGYPMMIFNFSSAQSWANLYWHCLCQLFELWFGLTVEVRMSSSS